MARIPDISTNSSDETSNFREHHLDFIRAFLMLLGIPYHASLPFRDDGQSWLVLSGDRSRELTYLFEFLHLFRMQGFFLIAGYFTAMLLLKREPGAYLRNRLARLLPPLATGLLVIVPFMNLAVALQQTPNLAMAIASWADQAIGLGRSTTGHLWFVIVLIYFSAASAAIALAPSIRVWRLGSAAPLRSRVFVPALLAAGLALGAYQVVLLKTEPLLPEPLVQPLSLGFALQFAPWFSLGLLINRVVPIHAAFNRFSWAILIIALGAALVAVGAPELPPYTRPVLAAVAALALTQALVAAARRLFARPSATVRELVDASFTIYLLHLPIIIAIFSPIEAIPAPYPVRYLLLVAITFALSFAAWLAVKRHAGLLFVLSGVRRKHG